jgi:hypothetical protein
MRENRLITYSEHLILTTIGEVSIEIRCTPDLMELILPLSILTSGAEIYDLDD